MVGYTPQEMKKALQDAPSGSFNGTTPEVRLQWLAYVMSTSPSPFKSTAVGAKVVQMLSFPDPLVGLYSRPML